MDNEELDIELIEKYLKGTLTPEELKNFDQRIKDDADFAEKIEDYKDIIDGIQLASHHEFKAEVASWEEEIKAEEGKGKQLVFTPWKKYLSIAATLILLVTAGIYFLMPPKAVDSQHLFYAYFTPYEDIITVRGDESDVFQEKLQQAMVHYNNQNYQGAITLFRSYLESKPEDDAARLYLGICFLTEKEFKKSIDSFDPIISTEGRFKDQAEWYSALAYLASQDLDRAKQSLSFIVDQQGHDYNKKAIALLKEIN